MRSVPQVEGCLLLELAHEPEPERSISAVLGWLPDSAGSYLDFAHGGRAGALRVLARCLARESSELSIRRVTLLLDRDQTVGGFLALSGADLSTCVRADSRAMLMETDRAYRGELAARLRSISKLRPPVDDDVFYLSKLGVVAERRGEGLGRALALEYIAAGSRAGFCRFQLDVESDNRAAISLYESIGMSRVSESTSEDGRICLHRMARECER